ncbi:MAG: tyrosine-type recombinase/integrase [Candidatus Rokubacteria bacterium]|nr:tyrosine-type recombinase/integrase [Candidatus Rokubacteria bacterium]
MSALRRDLDDYLVIRRALGFKLARAGLLLADFVAHLEANEADTITTDAALAWATRPPNGASNWWAQRLAVVRSFARHLHAIDPTHEVPPPGLLPGRSHRATPYLYSDRDIAALMAAARGLRAPLRAATFETLVGLLAVTGLRIGEALRLDRDDVDLVDGVLVIRLSKFGKSREVPLHPSTVDALAAYTRERDRLCRRPVDRAFFVSTAGTRLLYCNAHLAWLDLVRRAGLQPRSATCRPRPHDLRHSFAVRTLLGWYPDGADVHARMPLLSTYLGHVHPGNTYWYLSAAPELLTLVVARLDATVGAPA